MDYITNVTCAVSIFHESASVSTLERAIGRKAERSTNRGDPRPRNGSAPYDRSSAYFEVVANRELDPRAAISDCLDIIETSTDIDVLRQSELWIILGLNDPDFVQVALSNELIERLGRANVGLAIENRGL